MAYDIGAKVGIDGEADFKQSLKSINGELKSVGSEMRAVSKEFKDNADSMEALTAKNKILQKEIDLQKQKVETLSNEYKKQNDELSKLEQKVEEAKQKYGENSAEVQKAQKEYDIQAGKVRKLDSDLTVANSTLNRYTKDMDINTKSIQDQTSETAILEKELSGLADGLTSLEDDQKKLTSAFKLQRAELGNNATEAEKMELAQKQLKEQIELTDKVVANLESQLDKAKQAYGENSKEVKDLETKLNGAKTEVTDFKNKLDDVESGAKNAGDGLDQMNQNVQSITLFEMADALSAVSDKLIDLGRNAITAFEEYDSGMDIIVTKTGATGEAAQEFGEIYDRVTSSMYTQSFEDVGSSIGELNTQFGLMGDELTSASEYMLMYAEINGTDVTSASISAKQAIEAYGLSNQDLVSVLDAVTVTAQATGQSVDSLFQKAVDGAPQIKMLGLTFDEGVQLMGDFEKAGVDSSAALSSLSKASVNYAQDGKTLSQGLKETQDAILGAKDETEALSIASDVFGTKAAPRMVDAIQRGVLNLDDLATASETASGTVARTFEETLDPIDKFKQMGTELSKAFAPLGNAIAEAFSPLVDIIVPIIQTISQGFEELPQPIQTIIVAIGALVTGFVALMPIVAIATATFNTIAPLFAGLAGGAGGAGAALAGLAGPVGIAVAAIAAIAAVIKGAWDNSEIFRDSVGKAFLSVQVTIQEAFGKIQEAFGPVIESFGGFGEKVNPILQQIGDFLGTYIVPIIMNFFNTFISGFTNIIVAIAPFIAAIGNLLGIIGNFVGMVVAMLNSDWAGAWEFAKGIGRGVVDFLGNIFQGFGNLVNLIFQSIADFIKGIWEGIKNFTSDVWTGIKTFLSDTWGNIKKSTTEFVTETVNKVKDKWEETKKDTSQKWNDIKNDLSQKWNDIKKDVSDKVSETARDVSQKWQETKTDSETKWASIRDDISIKAREILNNVVARAREILEDLPQKWQDILNDAVKKWGEIKDGIVDAIKNLPETLKGYAVDMLTKMAQGIKETAEDVWGAMVQLADDLKTKFKNALGINSPSTVFKEFGQNIVQGLLGGLNANEIMGWVNDMVQQIKDAFSGGNFNLQAAIEFIGSGAAEFFQSIGVGGAAIGDLAVPVAGGITSDFGWRTHPITGDQRFHEGIDIGAAYGTPVGAAGAGTVTMAGWNGGYGNTVMIDHGNGLSSLYAHLSSILVSVGELVSKLQTIGLVGSTGNSTGPHLHFGLYDNGSPIDPSKLWGYARGTNFATSGYHWVGENGPELMKFNGGEKVINSRESEKAVGGITQHVNIYSPTSLSPAQVAKQSKRAMRDLVLSL